MKFYFFIFLEKLIMSSLIITGPVACHTYQMDGNTIVLFGDKHGSREGGSPNPKSCLDLYFKPRRKEGNEIMLPLLLSDYSQNPNTHIYLEAAPMKYAHEKFQFLPNLLISYLQSGLLEEEKFKHIQNTLKDEIQKLDYLDLSKCVLQDKLGFNVHACDIRFSIHNQTFMGQHIGASLEETSAHCIDYLSLLLDSEINDTEIIESLRYTVNTPLLDEFYFESFSYDTCYKQIKHEISNVPLKIQTLILQSLKNNLTFITNDKHQLSIMFEKLKIKSPSVHALLVTHRNTKIAEYRKMANTFIDQLIPMLSWIRLKVKHGEIDTSMKLILKHLFISSILIEMNTLLLILLREKDGLCIVYQGDQHILSYCQFFDKAAQHIETVKATEEFPRMLKSHALTEMI